MADVVLINPCFTAEDAASYASFGPPLGLLALSAHLKRGGYSVCFIDPQYQPDYLDLLREALDEKPLFVGMSTYLGPNLSNAVAISKKVKEWSPATPVVWGGPYATSVPETCLTEAPVDYVAMGMGETTALSLCAALRGGQDPTTLENVSHASANGPVIRPTYYFDGDLDELAFPDLEAWEEGIRKIRYIPILSSRGCPRNCAFCFNNTFTGRKKWYARSAQNVLEEMRHWSRRFGLKSFLFSDDNFLVDTKRACTVLDAIRENGYKIIRLHGNLYDFKPEILERIPGIISNVTFCIESASPKIQTLLNKRIDLEKSMRLVEFLAKSKIGLVTAFMFGLPTETDEDIRANIEMAEKIHAAHDNAVINPYIYIPQPKDDIATKFDFYSKIDFSLKTTSSVQMVVTPPFDQIDPAIHPWLTPEDIAFLIRLVRVWFFLYISERIRPKEPVAEIEALLDADARLRGLFGPVLNRRLGK